MAHAEQQLRSSVRLQCAINALQGASGELTNARGGHFTVEEHRALTQLLNGSYQMVMETQRFRNTIAAKERAARLEIEAANRYREKMRKRAYREKVRFAAFQRDRSRPQFLMLEDAPRPLHPHLVVSDVFQPILPLADLSDAPLAEDTHLVVVVMPLELLPVVAAAVGANEVDVPAAEAGVSSSQDTVILGQDDGEFETPLKRQRTMTMPPSTATSSDVKMP